jgi:hypothetical protein
MKELASSLIKFGTKTENKNLMKSKKPNKRMSENKLIKLKQLKLIKL